MAVKGLITYSSWYKISISFRFLPKNDKKQTLYTQTFAKFIQVILRVIKMIQIYAWMTDKWMTDNNTSKHTCNHTYYVNIHTHLNVHSHVHTNVHAHARTHARAHARTRTHTLTSCWLPERWCATVSAEHERYWWTYTERRGVMLCIKVNIYIILTFFNLRI